MVSLGATTQLVVGIEESALAADSILGGSDLRMYRPLVLERAAGIELMAYPS
jgi:hypothetical protein